MEVLSRKIFIDTGNSVPKLYMTPKQLCEFEGRTDSFFRKIFAEISSLQMQTSEVEQALWVPPSKFLQMLQKVTENVKTEKFQF